MNASVTLVGMMDIEVLILVHLAIIHTFYDLSCDEESPETTFSLRDLSALCRSASCFFLAASKGNLS